ncbi:MAG: tetratricopeptide repeat protein, partial [Terracidiphilus sp.]
MRTLGHTFALFTLCVLHLPIMGLPPGGNAISDDPTSTASVVEALQNGKSDDALRMCNELLRESPKSPKIWTLRAVALDRSGRTQDALDSYQQALRIAPGYLAALEGAAQLEYKAKSKDAIPLLQRIVVAQPANQTAHAMLGALEYRQKDYAKAAADFDAAGDLVRSHPAALMDDSLCLIHLDRQAEAIQNLKELVQLAPENYDARYDLALVQSRASSAAAEALATLQPALDAHPPNARAMRLAAAIHESNNETPQAVELLRSAILANPDDIANYLDFATLAFTHGSFSVGVDIVSAGIARLPNAAPLYMARGVLYGQDGDLNKAIDDFEHAHRLDPV